MMRLFLLLAVLLPPCTLPAQSTSASAARQDTQGAQGGADPVAALNGYYDTTATGDWNRAVRFLHPRTLTAFRATVDTIVRKDTQHILLPMLLGVSSMAEFKSLSDQEVMVRFYVRQLDSAKRRAALSAMRLEVMNVRMESADRARVTARVSGDPDRTEPEDMWVLRVDGRWFVLLSLEP